MRSNAAKFALSFSATLAAAGIALAAAFWLRPGLNPLRAQSRTASGSGSSGSSSASGTSGSSGSSSSSGASGSSGPDASALPAGWEDNGIFSKWYPQAYQKLRTMTLAQKVGQVMLARCPGNGAAQARDYQPAGYVLFARDFSGKTAAQVRAADASYQAASKIPMLLSVDEEGGTVVRISSNPRLASSPFRSPRQVYNAGGLAAIRADTAKKAALLESLGLNLNLAPVADVSRNPSDYIYPRALGLSAAATGRYVAAVVETARQAGISSTLKHFPGYGDNKNTHTGISIDRRPYSTFETSDFIPFEDGIAAGAESVLVSHNIVTCMDKDAPASLSPAVHQILRQTLHFTGVIMTDDLSMDAVKLYAHGKDPTVQALLAGNDLLLTDDLPASCKAVTEAVEDGTVPESTLDRAVWRVLAWKYAEGMLK